MVTEQRQNPSPSANHLPAPARLPPPPARPHRTRKSLRRATKVLVAVLAVLLAVWVPVRTWAMNWGATSAEVQAVMPGDGDQTHAISVSTRAVTINAPAHAIWPWLVQMGYQRAGWYSYDWIEWVLGCDDYVDGHSASRIHSELQHVQVGDMIYTANGVGSPITHLKRDRHMVLGRTWAFVLKPIDATHTRLVVRTRHGGFFSHGSPLLGGVLYAMDRFLALPAYEPGLHFFMERRMLLGIKERAERSWSSTAAR